MKIRREDIEIPSDKPYENDKLDRKKYGKILTDIVSFYGQSGCVMFLNGEWGAGKTTFVKMWKQELHNSAYKTLYFNAWTSDYCNDPLMALVSELQELNPSSETIKRMAEYAFRIGVPILKGLINKAIGVDPSEVMESLDKTKTIEIEWLKEYANQKSTIDQFKRDLIKYVADNAADHPIVFFVDELDRCNPHYAVAVLERIKHFFDIPNIVFVLAINKAQLCNAIQGYFGSANLDANEYLRRFINLEYTLPRPKIKDYCEFLYQEYGFDEFFNSKDRENPFSSGYDEKFFKDMAIQLCEESQSNLRQIDRIFAYSRLGLMQVRPSDDLMPQIYFLLCFWKIVNDDFYNSIKNKEFTVQELLTKLEENLPRALCLDGYPYFGIHAIASFLYCYDKTKINDASHTIDLDPITDENGSVDYRLKTRYINIESLNQKLNSISRSSNPYHSGLRSIFERVDLLNSFQM